MATTAVQEGFFRALKPNKQLSDTTQVKYVLQGGGNSPVTTVSTQTPASVIQKDPVPSKIDFVKNTTPRWNNVSRTGTKSYSQVQIKAATTDAGGGGETTFCTLPLNTSIAPSGTDVDLTSAKLTVNTGVVTLAAQENLDVDITLINDEDGTPTYLTAPSKVTSPIETISYTASRTNSRLTLLTTTDTIKNPTQTFTDVDGARAQQAGGNKTIVSGSLNTTVSFTTNATVNFTSYTVTFT